MKPFLYGIFFLSFQLSFAQQDSIVVSAKLSPDLQTISVQQTLLYHNPHDKAISQLKLQNWVAAYNNRKTHLLNRKLQDRKKDLYFAKEKDLGRLESLSYVLDSDSVVVNRLNEENIYISLKEKLNPKSSLKISLSYKIKLPNRRFTTYGTSDDKVAIKYFFITPDHFEDDQQSPNYFIDVEQNVTSNAHWEVNWDLPVNWIAESNLNKETPYFFEGQSVLDPEFLLSKNNYSQFIIDVKNQKINVQLAYPISVEEQQYLEFYLPYQLQFINERLGILPEKIFITEKFKDREKFIGADDVKFWRFNYKLFSNAEKIDLNYFSIVSKAVINQALISDKVKDHWIKNGLKTYLEIQYLKENYTNHKLLGDLPEQAKILGLKPLKIFHAADLKLLNRYGLAYQYILNQNLDQPINLEYDRLSNFNTTAISHFETGILFNYISENMGNAKFQTFLKNFLKENKNKLMTGQNLLHQLELTTDNQSSFLTPVVQQKNRINFKVKNFEKTEDSLVVNVSKNTDLKLPFRLDLENNNGTKTESWQLATERQQDFKIKYDDADKIVLNDDFAFPETSLRDNYLYTKGFFSNMKKIKFKLLRDVQNPEFNEVFLMPRLSFNAYDKVLVGLNFVNKGVLDQKFIYSVTPYYSSGTNKITGSAGVSYTFLPANSFYRSLTFSTNASYFHYDFDLAYRRINFSTSINFNKDPRSAIGRNLYASYGYFEKDLDEKRILANEYGKYNLWNVGYTYSDNSMIHEKSINANVQGMEDFLKLSTEAYYRWEYAKDKKISFRWFVGYFAKNKTQNASFDYGLSRVNNYAFSYGLFGQSATSGLFSQQFILAEGGFKSHFNNKVNHWLTSVNVDSHIWKMFNIYADFGVYKNENRPSQFIWDSGIKLRIIPDFLEVYFPIQSSLGFEPAMKDYGYRIRYTLVFNLNALIGNLRRGVY